MELGSPVHEALMVLLGAQAQREVTRARQRVLAAMRAQSGTSIRPVGCEYCGTCPSFSPADARVGMV